MSSLWSAITSSSTQAAQQTGQQAAQQAAQQYGKQALQSGAIGQSGITGGLSTYATTAAPKLSAFNASAGQMAQDLGAALGGYAKDYAQQRLGMKPAQAPDAKSPDASTNLSLKGAVHGMLSPNDRKHSQAASMVQDVTPPAVARNPRTRQPYQGGSPTIQDIIARMFAR